MIRFRFADQDFFEVDPVRYATALGEKGMAAYRAAVDQIDDPGADALRDDLDEIDLGHGPVSPRLHLALHEVVATQLWEGDPPEVWETALRLRDAGYERHEILHMLSRPVSDQVWAASHDAQPYDRERHVAALLSLPGSWERERTARSATERHEAQRSQARKNARASRRRNRRPK